MPLVTTSRKADQEQIQLSKELAEALDAEHERRGKKSVHKLVENARKKGQETLFILSTNQIKTIKLDETNWNWKDKIEFEEIQKPSQELEKTTEKQLLENKKIKLNGRQLKVNSIERI